jgi:hypothetical protein
MIEFPLHLIPDHITVDKLPIAPIATLSPGVAFLTHTIGLTDTPCGGAITFNYNTHSTRRTESKTYNMLTQECLTIEAGWANAWKFFSKTLKSGRLKFQISPNSPIWQRVEYYPEWLDISHSAKPSLWRMISITNDNGVGDIRQLTKFKISLKHEIRTPTWV